MCIRDSQMTEQSVQMTEQSVQMSDTMSDVIAGEGHSKQSELTVSDSAPEASIVGPEGALRCE